MAISQTNTYVVSIHGAMIIMNGNISNKHIVSIHGAVIIMNGNISQTRNLLGQNVLTFSFCKYFNLCWLFSVTISPTFTLAMLPPAVKK